MPFAPMVKTKNPPEASTLALQEYFELGDERFLPELYRFNTKGASRPLGAFAARWLRDERPFAREALVAYLEDGCERPFHRLLLKQLFKGAEKAGDDDLMARFVVAFDRLYKRKLYVRKRYDWQTKGTVTHTLLRTDPSQPGSKYMAEYLGTFSTRTRRYLQRRATRYLRELGRKDAVRFRKAAALALGLYRDEHLNDTGKLLGHWGLLHLLYHGSPVLDRRSDGVRVNTGRALAELRFAPMHALAWAGGFEELLGLAAYGRAAPVRNFALAQLKELHAEALRTLPLGRLLSLLRAPAEEVQALAAEALRARTDLGTLPLTEWLSLLRAESPVVLGVVAELVRKHVAPSRLDLAQCVELACVRAAPVGELGLEWVRAQKVQSVKDLDTVLGLTRAEGKVVREQAMQWLAGVLRESKLTHALHVRSLLDARFEDVRAAGLELLAKDARFEDETLLWSALAESPYDDVRRVLLAHLGERQALFGAGELRALWATTLLAVHRGSRPKGIALAQVAERLAKEPSERPELLRLLAVALRSVRPPERRGALARVATLALRDPSLRAVAESALPELRFVGEVVTA